MRQLQQGGWARFAPNAVAVFALASAITGCCALPGWTGGRDQPEMLGANRPLTPSTPQTMSGARTAESAGSSVIVLDVALIERPRGDAFLDQELWDLGNEQGVDLETKPILEENGLRVGQVGGLLPARLQALLTSPRSCPEPRRQRAEPEQGAPVQVGPQRQRLAFRANEGGASRAVELDDAVCYFEVTPTPLANRRVRLHFTPRIRHGKPEVKPRVARDPEGTLRWAVEASEPVEDFPALSWELTVGTDEYVLVGPRADRPQTLGAAYFFATSERGPVQKLLVLRAWPLADQAIDEALHQAPPLALQASWTPPGPRR